MDKKQPGIKDASVLFYIQGPPLLIPPSNFIGYYAHMFPDELCLPQTNVASIANIGAFLPLYPAFPPNEDCLPLQ